MSGIIKRLFLVNVKGRFKTIVYGPYTARSKADEVAEQQRASSEVHDATVDEMPANSDNPINLIEWLKQSYPNT